MPSERTLRQMANAVPESIIAYCHFGEKDMKDKYIPYVERLYEDIEAITTTANILRGIGADGVANKGMNVWKIVMVCAILGIILVLLSIIPLIGAIAAVLLIVVAIVEIIANILYLVFLFKSYKAIGA